MVCWGCGRSVVFTINHEYDFALDWVDYCSEVWYFTDEERELRVAYWCARRGEWWPR